MPCGLVHYETADYRNPCKCSELFERIVLALLESGIPQLNIIAQTAVRNHLLNNLFQCPFLGTGQKPMVGITTVRAACRRHSVLTFSLRIKDLFRIGPFRALESHSRHLLSSGCKDLFVVFYTYTLRSLVQVVLACELGLEKIEETKRLTGRRRMNRLYILAIQRNKPYRSFTVIRTLASSAYVTFLDSSALYTLHIFLFFNISFLNRE